MENFKEMLTKSLIEILNLTPEKAEEIYNFLSDKHGLECIEDLRLLNEDDLAPVMKTVQRRKFLLFCIPQSK